MPSKACNVWGILVYQLRYTVAVFDGRGRWEPPDPEAAVLSRRYAMREL